MGATISVVIPAYNRRDLVGRAVAAALAQTLPPLEVIVVDDCSTDGTSDAVRSLYQNDARVRVIEMPRNGGACVARNAGIEAARGEWVAFLDSDDSWEPGKLEAQLAACQDEHVAVFSGMRMVYGDGRVEMFRPPEHVGLDDLLVINELGSTSVAVVRREALVAVGGFDPGLPSCQDWDLWIRLAAFGRLAVVPDPLTVYDAGDHVRISRSIEKVLSGHATVFERTYQLASGPRHIRQLQARHAMWAAGASAYQMRQFRKGLAQGLGILLRNPEADLAKRYWLIVRYVLWMRLRGAKRWLTGAAPRSA